MMMAKKKATHEDDKPKDAGDGEAAGDTPAISDEVKRGPILGDVVYYRPDALVGVGFKPLAATVVEIAEDGALHLRVHARSHDYNVSSVKYGSTPGCWSER